MKVCFGQGDENLTDRFPCIGEISVDSVSNFELCKSVEKCRQTRYANLIRRRFIA